jgi:hypothetical protein
VQLLPYIQGRTTPMALQRVWWLTSDKYSSLWPTQTHVSWRFKKRNTIEGNKDPSPLSWLQRWHVTIIHLQVSNRVIVFISSHSRYLATLIIKLFPLATQWWAMFGGDTLNLQKLALRIVSQCCLSSGCEHNWSTFALIHTKVRNKLSYKKLHKLVSVNYNCHIRLR